MKTSKPKKVGILLPDTKGDIQADIWEVVLLYYFLERSKLYAVNILPAVIPLPEEEAISPPFNTTYLMGDIVDLDREIGKGIEGLVIPGIVYDTKSELDGSSPNPVLVNNEVRRFLREMYRRKKPIAASGLAVELLAAAISDITEVPLTVTVGNNPKTERSIESYNCITVNTRKGEVIIDETNRLITTAGHFGERKIGAVYTCMENLIAGLKTSINN